ncbi:MAG TPA: undecaprenyldiphospho-muramoylpentapeptide beta-N-acetylglucosaminyltransferase [Rhodospirillales bacterium]|nr:undecaprenyldiphospho-muramoylpentapeptide beta-N-acetylglucosaminyltransferase [Rhodospirillales bacterium]
MTPSLIMLVAGGTGGHVFPAEALAAELAARCDRLVLVTDQRGGVYGGTLKEIETYRVRAGGLAGKSLGARLNSGAQLAYGTWQSRSLLKKLTPGVVVGFGGYASVPTMLAAVLGGYRTAIHEQNAVLGRANRLLATRVARIATSFENSFGLPAQANDKIIHTGMPVRPNIAAMRERPYPALTGDGPINLLVLGGSQGARIISEVVPTTVGLLAGEWRERLRITQQCRPEDLEAANATYRRLGVKAELATFFRDLPERLNQAHLLICRAGASTVAEAIAVGRPAILVPYPHAIDDHQTHNAHAVDETSGGWLMPEEAFTAESLAVRLDALFGLPETLLKAAAAARASGRPDAARRLADMIFEMLPNGATGVSRRAA